MSLSFYHLREQPFGDTPDPRFLYKSEAHSRTLAGLLRHTSTGERLQTIIAPPGTGKTTLLFTLIEQIPEGTPAALLTNTLVNHTEFLSFLLRSFGVDDTNRDIHARRALLHQYLAHQARSRRHVIAIVDEAQNLDNAVLQEIRTLVEHAPESLQIILAGQPQLKEHLRERSVAALLSAIPHELRPLDPKETAAYVQHRLAVAGYDGPELFAPDAIRAIARESAGMPRSINMICYQALTHGASLQKPRIDREVVLDAIRRFSALEQPSEPIRYHIPVRGSNAMSNSMNSVAANDAKPAPQRMPDNSKPAPQNMPDDDSAAFATVLRNWLESSARRWTGTVSELVQVVGTISEREHKRISAFSAKELLDFVERSTAALRSRGVEVEIRSRPGTPRLISLRLDDGNTANVQPISSTPGDARKQPSPAPGSIGDAQRDRAAAPPRRRGGRNEIASAVAPETAVLVATIEQPPPAAEPDVVPVPEPAVVRPREPELPGLNIALDDQTPTDVDAIGEDRPSLWERVDRLYVTVGIGVLLVFLVLMLYARHATTHATAVNKRPVATTLPPANAEAITRLKHDADAGDPDAEFALGVRYAAGNGVAQNNEEALKLLRRAAEQGHAEAQFELGNLLSRDNVVSGYPWLVLANDAGVERSREILSDLTPKLSNSEIAAIRFELGQMFSNGVGVARDYIAAYTWFQLAQAAGDQRAGAQKAELRARMRTDQVAEASKRADDWLQQHSR